MSASESCVGANSNHTDHDVVRKRQDYLEWADYFMGVARLSAQRSKDPNTQVGACIVSPENKIVGIGYNGMPTGNLLLGSICFSSGTFLGCNDDSLPWAREGTILETKYAYICHAEMNAIMNKNSADLKNCTIYVDLFPCNECAKLIIQSGIKKVVYMIDKYCDQPKFQASRKLLEMARIEVIKLIPKVKEITISFDQECTLE